MADIIVDFEGIVAPGNFQYRTTTQVYGPITVTPKIANFVEFAVSSKSTFTGMVGAPDPNGYFDDGDDTISANGLGAGGSNSWLTAFNAVAADNIYSVAPGNVFSSVSINNAAIVNFTIQQGLGIYTDPFDPNGTDFLRVRFLSLDTNNIAIGQTSWLTLADYGQPNVQSDNFVLDNWTNVDLTVLNSNRVTFEFEGSDVGPFGLNTPTYLALDRFVVTAVPEPSSIMLVSMLAIGIAIRYGRQQRHNPIASDRHL